MDVREKLVELSDIQVLKREMECVKRKSATNCTDCLNCDLLMTDERILIAYKNAIDALRNAHGVTVQELALPEEEYYVLRNTETGMYFRGKGVNRWGKHFNQATIYRVKGTAEHSIKEVAWCGEKAELVRIKIVEIPQPPKGE